ncbi:hypothetical protein POTOM_035612 [Populus tomentosa]|uniref:Uncharacterized protein n=1 Tax=Populus tomentosa TaxID=118781 RepID=A0A8X8CMA0_POPTO|nr:hypothetical protein POTOM_035612 [Populus tomentosa]
MAYPYLFGWKDPYLFGWKDAWSMSKGWERQPFGGGKGFRVDYEALSWRTIQTKNRQASLIRDRITHHTGTRSIFPGGPSCASSISAAPLILATQRRSLYISSQLYHPLFCNP